MVAITELQRSFWAEKNSAITDSDYGMECDFSRESFKGVACEHLRFAPMSGSYKSAIQVHNVPRHVIYATITSADPIPKMGGSDHTRIAVFTDRRVIERMSPSQLLLAQHYDMQRQHDALLNSIRLRIRELVRDALEDGIKINRKSEIDLIVFLQDGAQLRQPGIVVTDDGNFRAVWKLNGEFVGLQFLGDGQIQYVIFHLTGGEMHRGSGNGSFQSVNALLRAWRLERVIAP